ncbi:MAG: helix-turn-helix domain-containing protein [Pseudomonadota bacterium]
MIQTVQLLVCYHALIIAGYLLVTRGPAPLALMCGWFAGHMAFNLAVAYGWVAPPGDVRSAFGLAYGPLLYLIVRDLARTDGALRTFDAVHGLPVLIVMLFRPADPWPQLLGLPLLCAYLTLAGQTLAQHRRITGQLRADDAAVDLSWVRLAFAGLVAVAGIDILRSFVQAALPVAANDAWLAVVLATVIVLLTIFAARAGRHHALAGPAPALPAFAGAMPDESAIAQRHFAQIDGVVRGRRLWRYPRLNLAQVAAATGLNTRDVSRAVNVAGGASFSTYINALRIAAFDALLDDPEQRKRGVLNLALAVGFNAKSSFNRLYRHHRGVTPTVALRRAQEKCPKS